MSNQEEVNADAPASASTGLDGITLRLGGMLDLHGFLELATAPTYTGGVQTGIALEPHQYHIGYYGKDITTVSFKKGGEIFGYRLAKAYNLRVTRLDIAHDVPSGSIEQTQALWATEHDRVKAHLALLPRQPSINTNDGVPKNNSLGFGSSYWSRNNSKQFAIYGKRFLKPGSANHYNYFLRFEERLHGDLADEVAKFLFQSDESDVGRLARVFQSVADELFVPGFFEFAQPSEFQFTQLPARDAQGGKEDWVENIVAPAIARYFKDTGKDLRVLLNDAVDRILGVADVQNAVKMKTTAEKKLARVQYRAAEKAEKALARAGLTGRVVELEVESETGE